MNTKGYFPANNPSYKITPYIITYEMADKAFREQVRKAQQEMAEWSIENLMQSILDTEKL